MISINKLNVLFIILITIMFTFSNKVSAKYEKIIYDFEIESITGEKIIFSEYKNKAILLVNVASQCGFTNQYQDIQKLWTKYQSKKVLILGVPSNDFGNQEPGDSNEIKTFCESKFGVTFPITEKVNVKGDNAHPFYLWAKNNYGRKAIPKWNFYKIIIGKDGKIVDTFSSMTNPSSKKFIKSIEALIK